MPKSRLRRRNAFTPPPSSTKAVRLGSPRWLVPLMVGLFVLGLAWVVVYYITEAKYPIESIGPWNKGIGFGFIIAGFVLSTRWK